MKLTTVHQVLMGGVVALCLIFAVRGVMSFARGGAAIDLAGGLTAVVVAVAVGVYLRNFRRKLAVRRPTED